jgi:hypothetical protein
MELIKKLTWLFGFGTAGVVVSFVMTIILGVQKHQSEVKEASAPISIPTPAIGQ